MIYKCILYTGRKLVYQMGRSLQRVPWGYRNAHPEEFPHKCGQCTKQRRFKRPKDFANHERDKHGMVWIQSFVLIFSIPVFPMFFFSLSLYKNDTYDRIGDVMVSILASGSMVFWVRFRSDQSKDYVIVIWWVFFCLLVRIMCRSWWS